MSDRTIHRIVPASLAWLAACVACAGEPAITDPTLPPGVEVVAGEPVASASLRLRSTQVSASSRIAIINDHIVTPGSSIGGAKVISIEPGRVTLRRGTELITLRMPAPFVKRPANGENK